MTVSQTAADAAHEDDEWVIDVNIWGVIHGTRAFLPILLEQDSGAIVNVSSVFGLIGFPTQSAYCASKFAVRGYTESLRHELRGTGVDARSPCIPAASTRTSSSNARFHVDDRGNTDHDVLKRDFSKSRPHLAREGGGDHPHRRREGQASGSSSGRTPASCRC